MFVVADLCVIPLLEGQSLSPYIAECQKILREAGLSHQLHAYGTNVEGEWDEVMAAVKRCHEAVHQMGVARIATNLKLSTRTDKAQTIETKVQHVEDLL